MLVNEVCKMCQLTKKAIEYYIEQDLVTPSVLENGYRDFSKEDVLLLKKISVLRGLGMTVADIQNVLCSRNATLNEISQKKLLEITLLHEKQQLIQELAKTKDWETVQDKLQQFQKKQSVLERLRSVFPGYYGNYICQHFAPYLSEPVRTKEQQEAFDTIIAFLDNVHLEIPDDLREYYDELTADYVDKDFEDVYANMRNAFCDIEQFVTENREKIENYMAYKQTAEYKMTHMYHLEEVLKQFNCASGYNDIFIPAMCRLSTAYREYHKALQQANEKFLQIYPKWGEKWLQG